MKKCVRVPRKLKPQKFVLVPSEAIPRNFAPAKIFRYTIAKLLTISPVSTERAWAEEQPDVAEAEVEPVELSQWRWLQYCWVCLLSVYTWEDCCSMYTVEPLIMDTPNKGHLSIKDTCFDPMLILSCTI